MSIFWPSETCLQVEAVSWKCCPCPLSTDISCLSPISLRFTDKGGLIILVLPPEASLVLHLISRPGQSQGLLYKYLSDSLFNPLILCENIFLAPPRLKG